VFNAFLFAYLLIAAAVVVVAESQLVKDPEVRILF